MNTMRKMAQRFAVWVFVAGGLLLMTGCNEQYLVWAPNGEYAAVLAPDGLRMCDANGKLTAPLMANVQRVAWAADSKRLVLAKKLTLPDWKACAAELGAERAAAVEADARVILSEVKRGREWSKAGKMSEERRRLAQNYLISERPNELKEVGVNEPQQTDLGNESFVLTAVVVAEWDGGHFREVRQMQVAVHTPEGMRVSPDGTLVAFVQTESMGADESGSLWALAMDSATPAVRVAKRVSAFPDWTMDGRELVYLQTSIGGESEGGMQVGTLSKKTVRVEGGRITVGEKGEDLAGLIVNASYRVRCLRDGRILFNAAEFTLPMAEKDFGEEREQLFCLDGNRQSTLVRMIPKRSVGQMPKGLSFFELSPDERQVIVGGADGEVVILTLATGEVDVVQKAADAPKIRQVPPGWRRSGEPWYVLRGTLASDGKVVNKSEVVVGRGDKVKVLSADWPEDLRDRMISGKADQ